MLAFGMRTLIVKLEPGQYAWLEKQAQKTRRSKAALVRELVEHRQAMSRQGSLAEELVDVWGCVNGSRDLNTRRAR